MKIKSQLYAVISACPSSLGKTGLEVDNEEQRLNIKRLAPFFGAYNFYLARAIINRARE